MCGICGFTGERGREEAGKILAGMLQKIAHRGPDGEGTYSGGNMTLGFRRLSIIDLKEGDQPLYNETRDLVCLCNGEIYNYRELTEQLRDKGHSFRCHSDAEVLVHAYEEWGDDLTEHLRGMYAFVIWDEKQKRLLAVRDPFGIKPFYYTLIDGELVFSSEIKAILEYPGYERELNPDALQMYLSFQYSVLPETFFKGIYRLMPGSRMIWQKNRLMVDRYFRATITPGEKKSIEQVKHDIEEALKDSVDFHLRSDTEVGILLSGGVDSVFLAALSGVDKAFTVGFEEEGYSEFQAASAVTKSLNMKHYRYLITADEYWQTMPQVQYMMDEPLADASAVGLYFVDRLAAGEVKTVLSGEGSDELFGGYPIYHEPLSLRNYQRIPKTLRKGAASVVSVVPDGVKGKGFLTRGALSLEERFIGNANNFSDQELKTVLKQHNGNISPSQLLAADYEKSSWKDDISRMQEIDMNYWLWGDILLKADKMSMAHSLECRVPYLDREVYSVARSLNTGQKISGHETKNAFRRTAAGYVSVDDARRKKLGFPVPIRIWLHQEPWKSTVSQAFKSETARSFFDRRELMRLLQLHSSGKTDCSRKIWTIYSFLEWYRQYF